MITPTGALILLVPVLPIAIWASVNDMKRMKIPNNAVLALAAVWPLLGWLAVATWTAWFWGFALMAIVLVAGYLLYTTGTFGAGDAKYTAAMAPIFVGADILWLLMLIAGCLLGALITHRIMRGIPAVRNMTPDWKSWTERRYFPLGFALSGIVVFYLVAAIWPQV
ncbi:prepilin peptidase [Tabrizicola piscis]|jgi:prepilin peptidase CpaA|uniref:prepilin peptidase n=1 Tax=Tabrizicola piscis TaxID=2494374 RepID=UPI001FE4899F|nr:prepilin peptidase [Tabrizicola piscis]